jgi:3-phosphoglycerate kinase
MAKPNLKRHAEICVEIAAYSTALGHATDKPTQEAMQAHIKKLLDEMMDALGLPEDEKARINAESKAAVEAQIKEEVEQALAALDRGV